MDAAIRLRQAIINYELHVMGFFAEAEEMEAQERFGKPSELVLRFKNSATIVRIKKEEC